MDKRLIQERPEKFSGFKAVESREAKGNPAILGVYEGPIQKKTKNDNDRVYTEDFWNEFFETHQDKMENKLLLGRLSHPQESVEFDLGRASHTMVKVWDGSNPNTANEMKTIKESSDLDDDLIYGRMEIFATDAGQNLHTMLEADVGLGVSSRALVLSEEENGVEYVSGGQMYGWDVVAEPSVTEAKPSKVEKTIPYDKGEEQILNELKKADTKEAQIVLEATNHSEGEVAIENLIDNPIDSEESEMDKEELIEELSFEDILQNDEIKEQIDELDDEAKEAKERVDELEEKNEELKQEKEELEDELEETEEQAKQALEEAREEYQNLFERAEYWLQAMREKYIQMEDVAVEKLEEAREEYSETKESFEEDIKELQEALNEAKEALNEAKEAYKELDEEYQEKIEELKHEAEDELQEKVVKFYTLYKLERKGARGNDKYRKYLMDSDSIEEVDAKLEELEKAEEAKESGLPFQIEEVDEEAAKTVDAPSGEHDKKLSNIIKHSR